MIDKNRDVFGLVIMAFIQALFGVVLNIVFSMDWISIVIIIALNISALFGIYFYLKHRASKDGNAIIYNNLKKVGIIDCTERLDNTDLIPTTCMNNINRNLRFMGVSGSKWVIPGQIKNVFEKMMRRIKQKNGEVHFLLINPLCDSYKEFYDLRDGSITLDSYPIFIDLCKRYPQLKVRLYDEMPKFRLQFMDDNKVAISTYKIEKSEYDKTNFGNEAPHLVVSSEPFWSLYSVFESQYNKVWEESVDILAVEEELKKARRNDG